MEYLTHVSDLRQIENESELAFLRRYFYLTRELVGVILTEGLSEGSESKLLEPVTDMIDEYGDKFK